MYAYLFTAFGLIGGTGTIYLAFQYIFEFVLGHFNIKEYYVKPNSYLYSDIIDYVKSKKIYYSKQDIYGDPMPGSRFYFSIKNNGKKYYYFCKIKSSDSSIIFSKTRYNNSKYMIIYCFHESFINLEKIMINEKQSSLDNSYKFTKLLDIIYYSRYDADVNQMQIKYYNKPNEKQELLINKIISFYNEHEYASVFLSGIPGCGKTELMYLLGAKLNGYVYNNFQYRLDSDNLHEDIITCKRYLVENNRPLIILLDEHDETIKKIHIKNEGIEKTKIVINTDKDDNDGDDDGNPKNEHNRQLEGLSKLYQGVILLIISNKTHQEISDTYEESYLRPGRVNIKCDDFHRPLNELCIYESYMNDDFVMKFRKTRY